MTDPHLDDEQLSLLLDGADVGERVHVEEESCDDCAARLAALQRARDAVAAAVVAPLSADVLDRIVGAALHAPVVADVVPLDAGRSRRRMTPPPAWLIGAAAGIAALVGVAGVLRAVDLSGSSNDDAGLAIIAEDESSEADAGTALRGLPGAGGADAAPTDPELVIGDLADQDDPAVLAVALDGLITAPAAGEAFSTTDLNARQAAPSAVGSPTAGSAAAEGDGTDKAPASAPPATTVPANRAQCRAQADTIGSGRFGELLSTATLRWKGRPAEVLVFRLAEPSSPGAPETRQALVLSRPGCELLADPRF